MLIIIFFKVKYRPIKIPSEKGRAQSVSLARVRRNRRGCAACRNPGCRVRNRPCRCGCLRFSNPRRPLARDLPAPPGKAGALADCGCCGFRNRRDPYRLRLLRFLKSQGLLPVDGLPSSLRNNNLSLFFLFKDRNADNAY